MKKLTKMMLITSGALLIVGGAVANYLMAQRPRTAQEELTLANLEAMAINLDEGEKWLDIEVTVSCEDFCYRDPKRACPVPIVISGPTGSTEVTYTCDSYRK